MLNPYLLLSQLWSYLPSDSSRKIQWVKSLSNKFFPIYQEKWARIEKQKRWNLIWEAPCLKRRDEKEDKICKLLGEILLKKRKKEITFSYSAKSDVWHHSYPHHLHLHYILFFDFSLSYPHSLHHSPSIMIIYHTNSLEFFFPFIIYKVYHFRNIKWQKSIIWTKLHTYLHYVQNQG
jgi:hypothetical protein